MFHLFKQWKLVKSVEYTGITCNYENSKSDIRKQYLKIDAILMIQKWTIIYKAHCDFNSLINAPSSVQKYRNETFYLHFYVDRLQYKK